MKQTPKSHLKSQLLLPSAKTLPAPLDSPRTPGFGTLRPLRRIVESGIPIFAPPHSTLQSAQRTRSRSASKRARSWSNASCVLFCRSSAICFLLTKFKSDVLAYPPRPNSIDFFIACVDSLLSPRRWSTKVQIESSIAKNTCILES